MKFRTHYNEELEKYYKKELGKSFQPDLSSVCSTTSIAANDLQTIIWAVSEKLRRIRENGWGHHRLSGVKGVCRRVFQSTIVVF